MTYNESKDLKWVRIDIKIRLYLRKFIISSSNGFKFELTQLWIVTYLYNLSLIINHNTLSV